MTHWRDVRFRRLVLAICAAAAPLFGAAPSAAHAVLVEASPHDGASLADAPRQVVLRFNEAVSPVEVRVVGGDGRSLTKPADVAARDGTVLIALPPLANGQYIVSFRVVSADSHPVAGSLSFAVGAEMSRSSVAASATGTASGWPLANIVNRLAFFASLFAAAGGVLYLAAVTRFDPAATRRARTALIVCAAVALASATLSLPLKGNDLAPDTTGGVLDPASWRLGASTSLGRSVGLSVAGLIVMIAGIAGAGRAAGPSLAIVGALAALGSLGLTGHAAEGFGLGPPLVILHAFVAAFWIGALWQLSAALHASSVAQATVAVERFSRFATLLVPLLILAGVILAWRQLGSADALLDPGYGWLLAAKLAMVTGLLGIALYNKLILTPRLSSTGHDGARALRRSIVVEGALVVVILGLTAALGHVPPPRATRLDHAAHQHRDAGFAAEARAGDRIVRLEVSPARVGRNVVAVTVKSASGAAVDVPEVTLNLDQDAAGIAPIERAARRSATGQFELEGPELSVGGEWRILVHVLIDDFHKISVPFAVEIR